MTNIIDHTLHRAGLHISDVERRCMWGGGYIGEGAICDVDCAGDEEGTGT